MSTTLPPLDGVYCHSTLRPVWERIVRTIRMPERLKLLALLVASYADRAGNQFWPGEAELAELAACTGQCERDVSALLLVLCDEYGLLKHVAYGISVCLQLTVPSDLDTRFEFCAPLPDAVSRRAE